MPKDVDILESGAYWSHKEENMGYASEMPGVSLATVARDLVAHRECPIGQMASLGLVFFVT